MSTATARFDGSANATPRPMTPEEKKVILASSLGTIFEWYDFYLFGVMAAIIGANFFTKLDPATRDIFTLLAFAAGFAVRPLGAIVCDVAEAQHQRERRALAVGRALCRQFRVSRSSEECKRYHLTFGVMQTGWRVSRIN